jgi:LPXTG-motif cell wall-anchored protein
VYAGFNYLANEMMKDRGGVSIVVDLNQSVNWQPYIGIGVMIIGASVLLLLKRKSAIL